MFITDRDLLAIEPDLFRDIGFLAQRIVSTTGSLSGGKLTITSGDFIAAGVTVGHVIAHNGLPMEIVLRNSATQVTVSLVRASAADPVITPPNAASAAATVFTFAPQIAAAHKAVLSMLGLPAAGAALPGEPDESAIVNPDDLKPLTAHLALAAIYAAASTLSGPSSALAAKADHHRARAANARALTAARLDINGDGLADAQRQAGSVSLSRA